MVAAIDRELEARAKGLTVAPEEQLEMLGARLYDAIGGASTATRRTEPRIAAQIWDALGDAQTVLNVGAGTGSYEPSDRDVTAVEPVTRSEASRVRNPARSVPCQGPLNWQDTTSAGQQTAGQHGSLSTAVRR